MASPTSSSNTNVRNLFVLCIWPPLISLSSRDGYAESCSIPEHHPRYASLTLCVISVFLTLFPALAFRKWLGGEDKINAYTHKLAMEGGKRLAEILGTRTLDESGEFTLNMVRPILFFIFPAVLSLILRE